MINQRTLLSLVALTFVVLSWLKIPVDAMGFANFKGSPGGVTLLVEDDVFRNRGVSYLNSTEFIDQRTP